MPHYVCFLLTSAVKNYLYQKLFVSEIRKILKLKLQEEGVGVFTRE